MIPPDLRPTEGIDTYVGSGMRSLEHLCRRVNIRKQPEPVKDTSELLSCQF